jgi:hypothetical protein
VLTSLPALTTDNTFTHDPVQLYGPARKALHDLKLHFSFVFLKGRTSKVDPEPAPIPTLLILMPDIPQPDLWYRAAKRIHSDLEPHMQGISVEIIEENCTTAYTVSPSSRLTPFTPNGRPLRRLFSQIWTSRSGLVSSVGDMEPTPLNI